MARLGSWDVDGYHATWMDVSADVSGWIDRDFIPFPVTPPPGPSGPGAPPTGGWEDPVPPEVRAQIFLDETVARLKEREVRKVIDKLLADYEAAQAESLVSLRPPEPAQEEWHAEFIPPPADTKPGVQINIGEVHVHHHHYAAAGPVAAPAVQAASAHLALPAPAAPPEQDNSIAMAALGAAIGGAIGGLPGVAIGALLGYLFFGTKATPALPPAPPPALPPAPTDGSTPEDPAEPPTLQ